MFNFAIYYTSARRKWKTGQIIVFVHKTQQGDALVGYGEIGNIYAVEELSEEERSQCKKWGWNKAIEFKYILKFEKPLLVKQTFLKDLKLRGKSFHTYPLNKNQLTHIIQQAEQQQHLSP